MALYTITSSNPRLDLGALGSLPGSYFGVTTPQSMSTTEKTTYVVPADVVAQLRVAAATAKVDTIQTSVPVIRQPYIPTTSSTGPQYTQTPPPTGTSGEVAHTCPTGQRWHNARGMCVPRAAAPAPHEACVGCGGPGLCNPPQFRDPVTGECGVAPVGPGAVEDTSCGWVCWLAAAAGVTIGVFSMRMLRR